MSADTTATQTSAGESADGTGAAGVVQRRLAMGMPWDTVDPFLFCVHHLDEYPAGDGRLAPVGSLAGRQIGNDFQPRDGWRMYHGSTVPGFPEHPHRGFETITIVRQGYIDHSDSLGAAARFGPGDVQWVTAGAGIQHSEMFPLLNTDEPNPTELFQIWLNLPKASKFADPHFSMVWAETVPVVTLDNSDQGHAARVTVNVGRFGDVVAPASPPESWASQPESDVAIWQVELGADGWVDLPAAAPGVKRAIYNITAGQVRLRVVGVEGAGVDALPGRSGAEIAADRVVRVEGTGDLLVMQGRAIGEPVAQYGPFVMNTREELEQAFSDYRRTQFGGWPWSTPDPTHGYEPVRFARRGDDFEDPPTH